jgi:hypothetical protein
MDEWININAISVPDLHLCIHKIHTLFSQSTPTAASLGGANVIATSSRGILPQKLPGICED